MVLFEKFSGCGNDFIFINQTLLEKFSTLKELRAFAIRVCHRHNGVGADGVVFYHSSQHKLLIINSDGSFAATCGNALRCYGLKLLYDQLWDGRSALKIQRIPRKKEKGLLPEEAFVWKDLEQPFAELVQGHQIEKLICVGMGQEKQVQIFRPSVSIPEIDEEPLVFVQLANPHLVCVSPNFQSFRKRDFIKFGLWAQKKLPTVLNNAVPVCNISMVTSKTAPFHLKVFERGAGLTLCCGSAAVATRIALETLGLTPIGGEPLALKLPGGKIFISQTEGSKKPPQRTMTGQAKFVFKGEILWI